MSIRFVEKSLLDVHNTDMTDRHQAPSYPLRMPPDLKERMTGSAKESGRSLHAEIVARLQRSFDSVDANQRDKLAVAVVTLKLLQRLVADVDLKENIGDMLEFISSDDDSNSDNAAEAIEVLEKKNLIRVLSILRGK